MYQLQKTGRGNAVGRQEMRNGKCGRGAKTFLGLVGGRRLDAQSASLPPGRTLSGQQVGAGGASKVGKVSPPW